MDKLSKKLPYKTLATLALMGGLYFSSPKLGHLEHETKKETIDALNMQNTLVDQETNDIINLVSGRITQDRLNILFKHYKQENDIVNVEKLGGKDNALRNTLWYMQNKYGNPTISFDGDFHNYQTGENEFQRARFNPLLNSIHVLKLDKSSLDIKNTHIYNPERKIKHQVDALGAIESRKKEILNNWIAELAHAQQLETKGVIKKTVDGIIDGINVGGDQSKLYNTVGSFEHEAHTIIEPQLVQEFLRVYEQYLTQNKDENKFFKLAIMSNSFDAYKNPSKYIEYLLKSVGNEKGGLAEYALGNYYYEIGISRHYTETNGLIKTDSVKIGEHTISIGNIVEKMKDAYVASYKKGIGDAGVKIITTLYMYDYGNHNDFITTFGKEILNHPQGLDKTQLGIICHYMSSVYFSEKNEKDGIKYDNLAREYGYEYSDYMY